MQEDSCQSVPNSIVSPTAYVITGLSQPLYGGLYRASFTDFQTSQPLLVRNFHHNSRSRAPLQELRIERRARGWFICSSRDRPLRYEAAINMDSTGKTMLHFAASNGNKEIVKTLCEVNFQKRLCAAAAYYSSD